MQRLPEFNKDFLVHRYVCGEIFSRDMGQIVWTWPNSQESFEKILDLDADADDLQNSLSIDIFLVIIFMKIQSVFLHEVANREIVRQTNSSKK